MQQDPIERFREAFARAAASGLDHPEAMALATADEAGNPSLRMVLLKGVDARGFVFYTNLQSRKGQELQARPRAALCFHWDTLDEQVRIEGGVEPVSDEEADAYFQSRPRGSQIGAWASRQSRELASRDSLEREVEALERKYAGGEVPRPAHWSGFRLIPERVEFWVGKPSRLHDRWVYTRAAEGAPWTLRRLYP